MTRFGAPRAGMILLGPLLALTACATDTIDDLTGAALAAEIGCLACHTESDTDIAPTLRGVWGSTVALEGGLTLIADEAYVRESVTDPSSQIVDGYAARMPSFTLTESEIDRLVDYVRSLG